MKNVRYRETASIWTQMGYPTFEKEIDLRSKLENAAVAGFDSVQTEVVPGLVGWLEELNLELWGYILAREPDKMRGQIDEIVDAGAKHITMHLLRDYSEPQEAIDLLIDLVPYAKKQGVNLSVETHRNTATETPEKFTTIANAFKEATGIVLPITCDLSHFAVVKHMMPSEWSERLLAWPEEIRSSQLFHCRPFNGHHIQVPVTHADGSFTLEVTRYLEFVKDMFTLWLSVPITPSEIFVIPEMGPADEMGYNLTSLPNSWEDAKILKGELRRVWREVINDL